MRTLVIGLDGVCLPVLDPMIDDGLVPNIGRLYDDSLVAPLESQLPPWTPSAWPSLYTGVNPGKHGVYDFLQFDGYDWDVVNRSHVKEYAVWELLSMEGFSSVVLNVPVTYPSREFDGVLVPGYTAPEGSECHPSGIWDELNEELGEYRLYNETHSTGVSKQKRVQGYGQLTKMRGAAFQYLVDEHDPDFGFVEFQQCDTIFHDYPKDKQTIRKVYRAIDTEVGKILDDCDPDVTLLVSDHGIGPMEGHEFRVNNYLRDKKFANTTVDGSGMPSWESIARNRIQEGEHIESTEPSITERAIEFSAKIGITSQRLAWVVTQLGLEDVILKVVPPDLIRAGSEQIDFASSIAYMRSRTEMGIRLNVKGREPDGVVQESEYEQVRDTVIESLETVTTPNGDELFEGVYPREDIYEGPYTEDAPDIITVPNRFDNFLVSNIKESVFGDPTEPWEHKLEGVVMVTGDLVDCDTDLSNPHLFDITPTVLATFGLPTGKRMDGTPLPVVESMGMTDYPTFDPEEAVKTDTADVEQRLVDLGYLD